LIIDLTGQRFSKLVVIERAENDKSGKACWKCICDCGKETIVSGSNLRSGHTKSCGCNREIIGKSQLVDLTGQKFGKLIVVGQAERNKQGNITWKCICDCGKETIVRTSYLINGHTKSCGCNRKITGKNQLVDLTGQKFGKLIVIERYRTNKQGNVTWRCKCDCGNETIVIGSHLKDGHTKSCGHCGMINLTGKRFGKLIAIEPAGKKNYFPHWKCVCDCGNETIVSVYNLKKGHTTSCGCWKDNVSKIGYGEAAFNRLLSSYKRDAKRKGLEFLLTDNKFKELIYSNCYYCGQSPTKVMLRGSSSGELEYTGIDRIDNSKGYIQGNVRPCCTQCNIAKSSSSEEEYLSYIKSICEHLNLD